MTTHNLRLRAQLLMQQGRHEQAEQQLRLALAEDSSDAASHAMLAICLTIREAWEEATNEARQAIAASPDGDYPHFAMAFVLRARNRLKEARDAIQEALRLDPTDSDYHAMLASIEASAEQWKDCLTAAETGLSFDAEHEQCGNLRAMALTRLGRRAEAGQTIAESLRRDPENALTHANEGWRLLHARQPQAAMTHFREALRLRPELEWARHGMIEAMKARHFIYRWMLSFFLWVGRFPPKVQLALMIGFPLCQNVLQRTLNSIPALSWLSLPVSVIWLTFIWLTWSSSSLTELLLMCSRFGRLALNRREKIRASLIGLCVLAGIGVSAMHYRVSFVHSGFWSFGLPYAGLLLGLTIPIQSIFLSSQKSRLRLAIGAAIVITGAVVWANVRLMQIRPLLDKVDAAVLALDRTADPENAVLDQSGSAELPIANTESPETTRPVAGIPPNELVRPSDIKKQVATAVSRADAAWVTALWMIAISSWLGIALQRTPVRH